MDNNSAMASKSTSRTAVPAPRVSQRVLRSWTPSGRPRPTTSSSSIPSTSTGSWGPRNIAYLEIFKTLYAGKERELYRQVGQSLMVMWEGRAPAFVSKFVSQRKYIIPQRKCRRHDAVGTFALQSIHYSKSRIAGQSHFAPRFTLFPQFQEIPLRRRLRRRLSLRESHRPAGSSFPP